MAVAHNRELLGRMCGDIVSRGVRMRHKIGYCCAYVRRRGYAHRYGHGSWMCTHVLDQCFDSLVFGGHLCTTNIRENQNSERMLVMIHACV